MLFEMPISGVNLKNRGEVHSLSRRAIVLHRIGAVLVIWIGLTGRFTLQQHLIRLTWRGVRLQLTLPAQAEVESTLLA